MVIVSLIISGFLGLAMGVGLYVTRPGNLLANRAVFAILNLAVNIVRPIPFIIVLAAVGPLTLLAVHTTIGTNAVVFALSLAASFAVSRIVEQNLVTVDPAVIEAARAVGAGPWNIIVTVLIPEGLGPLILGFTFVYVGIVDMSAQAALVGGGGLGEFAITHGYQRYNWTSVYITVLVIIVIVQAGRCSVTRSPVGRCDGSATYEPGDRACRDPVGSRQARPPEGISLSPWPEDWKAQPEHLQWMA